MDARKIARVYRKDLEKFCADVFTKLGLSEKEAIDSAEILVAADARGISSHGVGRLWRYKNGLQKGIMIPDDEPLILRETPLSLVLDGNGAMGMSLAKKTMQTTIEKANQIGVGFASIRNTNHFGIAGYYSEMAAQNDMIGIAMTNTAALGVPTFGREAMFGTNPIAVAVPALEGRIFSLDMSTTVVTRGKIEIYEREGNPLPGEWAVDKDGAVTANATQLLEDMLFQRGGGLLPLGGASEELGGHKGYGLAVLVDIMTAITSGGMFGRSVKDSEETSARVCHFFGAIRLDIFREPNGLKRDMHQLLQELNNTEVAIGADRVYWAGQKEQEHKLECEKYGVPISIKVYNELVEIADTMGVVLPPLVE
jgi:L-2-hydroxycarboxylate dehydrogenase (NAD+)